MEDMIKTKKRGRQTSWKNNVEDDLKGILDKKGVIGAFLISKNGETVSQVFQETLKHKEGGLMQFVKKVVPAIINMRNVPLRRTIFETKDGSVIFHHTENGIVGCVLDKDYDLITIMLDVRMAGELIDSHLNNDELDQDERDIILRENRDEFRTLNSELLTEIEKHFGYNMTEALIQRTVR
ncbi:hypothetical protein CUJ83_13765 [Methanocella sp. CWC-04]|uniref:Uncharacterized protein n=1 Tax=Methanooceanicella nereidis TaxID=2052831 RepID=A0AAP2W8I2_9EURY|nr:hypothetical protein [Methanocella sp. CWC-04]MCD1296066.1 hypothetical protein [Methanocella sp. CWC-04]